MENHTSVFHSKDDRFRYILENLGDLVWSVDMDFNFTYISPSFERIMGYKIEEMSKMTLMDIFTFESFKSFKENIIWDKALNKDGWHVMEIDLKRKDNKVFKAHLKLSLIEHEEDGLYEILGACRKISDENINVKNLEKELIEWQNTFDAVSDIVALISPDFEILRLNKKGYDFVGLKPMEVIGRKCYKIIHKTDSPIPECPCSKTLVTKEVTECDFSQNDRHYIATAAPIVDENHELIAFTHTLKDITRRKNMQDAIEESEEKYRNIIEQSTEGIILLNEKGIIIEWNKAQEVITGLKKEYVMGKPFWDILDLMQLDDEKIQGGVEQLRKMIVEGLRNGKAHWLNTPNMKKIKHRDGSVRMVESLVFPITTSKGIIFGSTSRDITNRVRAEEAIKEGKEKYRLLFEKMLDGFAFHKIIVDENNKPVDYIFLEVNSEFENLTDLKREDIIGKRATEVIPGIDDDPDNLIDIYGAVALEGKEFNFEQYIESLGKWFSVSTYSPKKWYFAAVFEDITQRKYAEEAFQTIVESTMGTIGQEYFDKIVENLCYWLKADGAIIGEIVGEDEVRAISMVLDGKQVPDFRYKLKGSPCEEAAYKGYCFYPDNVPSKFRNYIDLNELKARSYMGVSIRNTSGDPIGILCVVSRQVMKAPYQAKEVLGIIAAKASAELERIQAESALIQSEEQFRALFEHAGEALFLINPENGKFVDVNERACGALDYKKEELLNLTISDIDPSFSNEQFIEFAQTLSKDKAVTVEANYQRKDQSHFPVEIRTGFIEIQGKTHLLSLVRDITLRRKAEEKLQWELDVNKALAELSNALISPTTQMDELVQIVLAYSQNLTNSEHGFVSTIDPDTGDNVGHTLTKMMESCLMEGENRITTFPKGPNGKYNGLWGHALNTKRPFYTNSPREHEASLGIPEGHISLNNFLSVPAVIGGILVGQIALANTPDGFTDRKLEAIRQIAHLYALAIYRMRAEEQLRESEEKFRELADLLPETIFLANDEGMLTFVNQAGLKAFGYDKEDMESDFHILEALSPEDRARGVENISMLFSENKAPGTEYLAERKDGSKFPVVIYANPVISGGKPAGLRGIVVDITERKKAEEQIEKALSEKKLLLSELKHRVNNNLQLLMSMVNMWIMEAQSEEAKDALHEVEGLISAMALVHSEAHIDGTAKRIKLKKFLKELASGIIKIRSHQDLEVTHSVEGDEIWLELDQANPVSLIANELLLNALKHAFIGRESGHIKVSLKDKENAVNICVKDNGVGISKEVDLKKPDSLGLDLINNMVEQLNGKIDIINEDGTKIEIEFPKGVEQNGR